MELRLTTLSENTASPMPRGLLGEWGLSVLVEKDDLKVLLDAGQNISTVNNGDILGMEWSKIDKIVLSHGHYDHTGGLWHVLCRMKKQVEIVAHPDAWKAKYAYVQETGYSPYIGIPYQKEALETLGAQFKLTAKPTWLSDNIVTSGVIPMITEYEATDAGLYFKEGGDLLPDLFQDDQALFIKTGLGLVVVLGCAHRGIINTLRHAQQVTGVEVINTVIGGTHLFRASDVQLERTVAELKTMGIQRLGVSHCTGMLAGARLAQEFGPIFFFNNTGTSIAL